MKPYLIGLTGGIASGKSEAAAYLKELGAYVIDSDVLAREVAETPDVKEQLRRLWPSAFRDGELNRSALRSIVFSSKKDREMLNSILHPRIRQRMAAEIEKCPKKIGVLVVPLLIETGLHEQMDEVWVVNAPKELQIQRLMERDRISRQEALKMLESQLPTEEKLAHAHFQIDNSGSLDSMKRRLKEKWETL